MDKLIPLTKVEILDEAIDGLQTPSDNHEITTNKMEVIDAQLEDLHHSIDIKEEGDADLEYQEDINKGTPSHSNSHHPQIKTEEIELNLDKLHHHPVRIQEEISVHLRKPETNCNPLTTDSGISNYNSADKPFKCEICDYRSAQKEYLKIHVKTHSGDKPFKCEVCNYKCSLKKYLKNHLRSHAGDKPFECGICYFKSAHKTSLNRHLKTHTG